MYYRDCLFGKTFAEILAERKAEEERERERAALDKAPSEGQANEGTGQGQTQLPSERWFQELRLDKDISQ